MVSSSFPFLSWTVTVVGLFIFSLAHRTCQWWPVFFSLNSNLLPKGLHLLASQAFSSGSYRDTRTSIWSTPSPGWRHHATTLQHQLVFLLSSHFHWFTFSPLINYTIGIVVQYVLLYHNQCFVQFEASLASGKCNNKVELRTFFHLPSCVCSYFSRNVALWTLYYKKNCGHVFPCV